MSFILIVLVLVFISLFIILIFSKRVSSNNIVNKNEQISQSFIMDQLLEIEDKLNSNKEKENSSQLLDVFNKLKERIQFSTPFGRISDNSSIIELEIKIKENLLFVQQILDEDLNEDDSIKLQKMLEDTYSFVIKRERLNIK